MRPLKLLVPAALAAVLSVGFLGQPASAASGDLAGTWTSTDTDGSSQTLDVSGSGNNSYSMYLFDDSATSACGGAPAKLVGTGVLDGNDLTMTGALVCLPGGNQLRFRIDYGFVYSAGTDTLTDDAGVVWTRS
jgi:hypothetical protein